MDTQPLGKGEVESSILSCSAIISNEINGTCDVPPLDAQARLRRGESGTAARIWQTLGDYYGDFTDFPGHPDPEIGVSLYRYFDAEGTLLYVGVSNQIHYRHRAHLKGPWAHFSAFMCAEKFPHYRLAEVAELRAIKAESPYFNIKIPTVSDIWRKTEKWYRKATGGKLVGYDFAWFDLSDLRHPVGVIGPTWSPAFPDTSVETNPGTPGEHSWKVET